MNDMAVRLLRAVSVAFCLHTILTSVPFKQHTILTSMATQGIQSAHNLLLGSYSIPSFWQQFSSIWLLFYPQFSSAWLFDLHKFLFSLATESANNSHHTGYSNFWQSSSLWLINLLTVLICVAIQSAQNSQQSGYSICTHFASVWLFNLHA